MTAAHRAGGGGLGLGDGGGGGPFCSVRRGGDQPQRCRECGIVGGPCMLHQSGQVAPTRLKGCTTKLDTDTRDRLPVPVPVSLYRQ